MADYRDPNKTTPAGPALFRRSRISYDCSDIPALHLWFIEHHGYSDVETRGKMSEYARLRSEAGQGTALVVLYHSGAVVVQGETPGEALDLLATLDDLSEGGLDHAA